MDIENELKKWSAIKFNGEMPYNKTDVITFAEHYHTLQLLQPDVIKSVCVHDFISCGNKAVECVKCNSVFKTN